MANVTGWNELINGSASSVIKAGFTMYNTAMYSNFIMIFWTVLSGILYAKTKSLPLVFTLGMLSYIVFFGLLSMTSRSFMAIVLIFELAGIIYETVWSQ